MSNLENISHRLKKLRFDRGMTQEQLAEHMDFARNYISMIERGKKQPGKRFLRELEQMEKGLQTSSQIYPERAETIIVRENGTNFPQPAPLISWASAGVPAAYEDQGFNVERIPVLCRDPHAYCLTIEGDSMEPRFIRGDIAVVTPSQEARNGDIVIARTKKDEVYFKLYTWTGRDREPVKLSSFNPAYPVMEIFWRDLRFVQPVHSVIRILRKD